MRQPVNAEGVKDCNISINAEDDCDDHDSHQNTLQEGMIEVWIESIMQVSDIVLINFVQLHDDCWDQLECEEARRKGHLFSSMYISITSVLDRPDVHVGQHD